MALSNDDDRIGNTGNITAQVLPRFEPTKPHYRLPPLGTLAVWVALSAVGWVVFGSALWLLYRIAVTIGAL